MKLSLYWGSASPYVRKVMIVAHELGIADDIEILDSAAHPTQRDTRIQAFNPLAKVPAARSADGMSLYDSRVICEYLNAEAGGGLFPASGPARWHALQRQALADGLLEPRSSCATKPWCGPKPFNGRSGTKSSARRSTTRWMQCRRTCRTPIATISGPSPMPARWVGSTSGFPISAGRARARGLPRGMRGLKPVRP